MNIPKASETKYSYILGARWKGERRHDGRLASEEGEPRTIFRMKDETELEIPGASYRHP